MTPPEDSAGFTWTVDKRDDGSLDIRALGPAGEAAHGALRFEQIGGAECRASFEGAVERGDRGRGLGRAMLAWAESAAREHFAPQMADGIPALLRVDADAPAGEAVALYRRAGLVLAVEEDEMLLDLREPPDASPLPQELALVPWCADAAPLFHHAYANAFRDRPGFPGWEEPRWRAAFTASEDFRAELSFVALDGAEPAGYTVCWVEGDTGWIVQMGVCPAWRRRGLGAALLTGAVRAFAGAGLRAAALEVATNNQSARRLYERTGFRVAHNWQSWRKPLD